jgi:RNA polymerase-binding transcription factor DksA
MDENTLEMAEALTQATVEEGIRRVVARLPIQPVGFDGLCIDCAEPIVSERIRFGAITCVECQILREKR